MVDQIVGANISLLLIWRSATAAAALQFYLLHTCTSQTAIRPLLQDTTPVDAGSPRHRISSSFRLGRPPA